MLRALRRANLVGGAGALVWLMVVLVPLYWIVVTSLRSRAGFFEAHPLAPPSPATLDNYRRVLEGDFFRYLQNSLIVTVATIALTLVVSFPAAHAIVRGTGPALQTAFRLFLLGLAIPLQATIIPVYLIIGKLGLYDSLAALVLAGAAFMVPLTVVVLVNFLRDVPRELYDAMRIDGASAWRTLFHLSLPLGRPAIVTVALYNALTTWHGFLFPLILTQSAERRVIPLGVWAFQGEFNIDVPTMMAYVVLSTLPIVAMYVAGRRQLVGGLTAGFSK